MTSESRPPSGDRSEPAPDADGAETWPEVDRRVSGDRRGTPTSALGGLSGRRRRRHGRRNGEHKDIYVDAFTRTDVFLIVGIFVLNIFDAFFTLIWLQRGGGESNPVMRWLLDLGDHAFLLQKCFVVGLWLLLLVVHKNFRIARFGLWAALGVYSVLILYHFAWIASGVDPGELRRKEEARAAAAARLEMQPLEQPARDADAAHIQPLLEQSGEQGRNGALDPQWPRSEAHGLEPGGA